MNKLYNTFLKCGSVCTDTRALKPGQLFVALKGENFDGNTFVKKALEAGAAAALASIPFADERVLTVPDTLEALQQLAAYHRRQFHIPVIGLTGTNGKTTTKELIKAVLSAKYNVTATEGNLNNDIGVPLSVLKINADTQIAIIEMGASHPEDLKPLLAVAQPTHGLITNVGKAHLLGFGSFEGVKHAKGLLYDYLKAHDGTAFANADDPILQEMLWDREMSRIPYGMEGVTLLPTSASQPFVQLRFADGYVLKTHLVGAYNANNMLAALKIGWLFGVPEEDARAAVEAYMPSNNRSQLEKTAKNTLIVDAYNANPSSMAVALDNLALCEGRKAALLGDMRELGADSAAEHLRIADTLDRFDIVYLVGEEFTKAAAGRYKCFASSQELAEYLKTNPIEGCTVLVKGSRGIRMENVIASL
ncbi:MAG: UDP-N-acetylmuramoyl-tripeptide--D-alanyl-D-alanine ligase [Bacteroidales bacterium]|nr:UDP-N-acetylmuramoyl-tripeptide--D-alanyl-D-alanine ligase [Bacteroidales bacterium]